jgi:hypothetical protein
MSFVTKQPEMLAATVANSPNIGSAMTAGNARGVQDGASDERRLGREEKVFSARRHRDRTVRSCRPDHPLERGWGKRPR